MAKKLTSTLPNMLLALTIIAGVAAGLLALVNGATSKTIAEGELSAKEEGIVAVSPEFDNAPFDEVIPLTIDGNEVKLYPTRKGGTLVGVAVESTSSAGYGGNVVVLVGIDPHTLTLTNYTVLAHSETPGLGDRMQEWFRAEGTAHYLPGTSLAEPLSVTKDGGTVDAISAATISSRAFLECVNRAALAVKQAKEEQLLK